MACAIPYVTIPESVVSIGLAAFQGGEVDEVEYIVKTIYVEPGDRDRIVNLLNIAHAVDMTMTSVVEGEPPTPVKTAKVVLTDSGKTLKFVYDYAIYPESTKGTAWFSVAEAEAIDPASGFVPWAGCAGSVTKVIFNSSFADCRPKHCGGWFWYFSSLASVKGLENLDVSKATSLARMFMGCSSLTSLDLAGFDTSCVTDMRGMFYGCTSLKRIAVRDKFVTTSVTASDGMFDGCTSLVGGAGTAYDSTKTDATYARIDGGPSAPGYFKEPPPAGSYGIHFDANGGTGTMADQICARDKVYNLTKCAFKKTGKTFKGWRGSNGRRYDDGILIFNAAAEGATLTLTAIWE